MSATEEYLASDAGQREVERHLAAVRAERGITEGLLGKFTERLHPRTREGKFAMVGGHKLDEKQQAMHAAGSKGGGSSMAHKALPHVIASHGKVAHHELPGHDPDVGEVRRWGYQRNQASVHHVIGFKDGSHIVTQKDAQGNMTSASARSGGSGDKPLDAATRARAKEHRERVDKVAAEDALSAKIAKAAKGLDSTRLTGNSLAAAKDAIEKARKAAKAGDMKAAEVQLRLVDRFIDTMDQRAEIRKGMSRRRRKSEVRDIGEASVALAHDVSYTEDMITEAPWRANLHPRDRSGKFRDLFTPGPTRTPAHDVVYARGHLDVGSSMHTPAPGSFMIHHATKSGPMYRITHRTDSDTGTSTGGFGVSEKTGQWVAWRQVGPKIPGREMIPVDVAHAKDVGDAEGTLEFDWDNAVRLHAHESMGANSNPEDWKYVHGTVRPMPKGKPVPHPRAIPPRQDRNVAGQLRYTGAPDWLSEKFANGTAGPDAWDTAETWAKNVISAVKDESYPGLELDPDRRRAQKKNLIDRAKMLQGMIRDGRKRQQ